MRCGILPLLVYAWAFLLPIFRWGIDSSSSFALFCVRWSIWGSGRHVSQ